MPLDEACLPATDANSAEALGTRTLRVRRSWNFPKGAPMEQRTLLTPHETMRTYIVVTGIALGLLVVWAALVPFVA